MHDGRGSLAYASVLVRRGAPGDIARAERIISVVATMQERREDDAHYGNFRWFYEDACVTDLNAVEFALDGLNELVRAGEGKLSLEAMESLRRMILLGLEAIDRLDVHPSYTNIALSDVCNSVLGGEAVGDDVYIERGRRRLDEWLEFNSRSGAPHEFNSPTYLAVDINRLATLAKETRDPEIALRARIAEERLWLHVASRYHPPLAQLAGPHSRAYHDGWTGASGYLKLLLWRVLGAGALRRNPPWDARGREEGHGGIARASYHVPGYIERMLAAKRFPYECIETSDAARGVTLTTYMTEGYTLGTSSRAYTVGEPPEPWPANNGFLLHFAVAGEPGYGIAFSRYVVNEHGPGARVHESDRTTEDYWEEGVHVAAQERNRAIVAYGLQPRMRPAHSYRLSVHLIGLPDDAHVTCAGDPVETYPHAVEPGAPVVIDAGGAYLALVPLEPSDMGSGAPIELVREGGHLRLDMYNYRGPAKTFWEHRSQAGPFFKGNVRNSFIVEVGTPAVFGNLDAFRAHVGAARISDSVDDSFVREIVYASEGGAVTLRYSLLDMHVVGARAAPMGRGGAVDGSGMQWQQGRESLFELNGATLLAGRVPKCFGADRDAGSYVFVNPSNEESPVWLETERGTVFECHAFALGRVEIDEVAGAVSVEASGMIGTMRVRGVKTLRLNGVDLSDRLGPADDVGARTFDGEPR